MKQRTAILLIGLAGCPAEREPEDASTTAASLAPTASGTSAEGGPSGEAGEEEDTGDKLDVAGDDSMTGAGEGGGPVETCEDAAMSESNQGCEFWAVDLPNAWAGINGSPAPQDQQFAVVVANVASDKAAKVDVFLGASDQPVDSAMVMTGEIHEFKLAAQNQAARANTYGGVAYRIESDVPITAYQFNPLDNTVQVFSNDASLLFPTHVLGTDYTAITGDAILLSTDQEPNGDNSGAYVSIVATEDGTTVDLYATWGLYPGMDKGVALNRGEVFTAVSLGPMTYPGVTGDGNLSGSRIAADKPVAVFSGNVATIEPNPGQCCADHMEHQMLPLVAWGHEYTAAPPPGPNGAATDNPAGYRITGAFDGTSLTYSPSTPPGAPTTIGAYQTVRFQTDQGFTVTSGDPDKPFALTQFLLSNQAISGFGQPGDPAMIALPAAAQYETNYIFLVPAGYTVNYVTAIRQAGTDVTLDGVSVAAGLWKPLGSLSGVEYEYIHMEVPTGSHAIGSEVPAGIVSVGYSTDVSYGYPGGSGVHTISEPPPPPAG
ncbi:MAG TPA: IgGFc-binding protein [Nannocystaceae bacterium]|nr:IgGFc-binding protein [Nannocystaceae bacterium]